MEKRADRKNTGKPKMHLIPLDKLVGLARVLEYGEKKYPTTDGSQNWRLGAPASEQISSLMRHLSPIIQYLQEPAANPALLYDEESGLPHIDHLMFNAISLRLALEEECDLEET